MTQRAKLELPVNQPVTIELLYDEPITGTSRYGAYYMYAVSSEGKEFSFFPPEEVHEQLKDMRRGAKAVITRIASQNGKKIITTYEVQKDGDNTIKSGAENSYRSETSNSNSSTIRKDNLYEIMLQCYKDALELQKELNGLADPEKIAVTLFIARSKTIQSIY